MSSFFLDICQFLYIIKIMQLRPYQQKIINLTRSEFLHGKRSVLIQLPTGGGKTLLTAEMFRLAANKGKRAWFIVHRRELLKQTMRTFYDIGVKNFGIVSAGFPESKRMPIQICSIQTLIRRYKRYAPPDFVCWDECKHNGSKTYSTIFEHFNKAYHIGLDATPIRLDGTGLGNWFKSMVNGPSVSWLIDHKYLSPYKLYAPSHVNTDGLHKRMGDYIKEELDVLMDKPTITGDAIKHYKKLCNGKRAVVFAVSIKHSKHIVEQFCAASVAAAHVDGKTSKNERDLILDKFRKGQIRVLSNVDLFGEGFDLPSMEAVILLRPTSSLALYLQQVGRVLRYVDGKTAIILDHVGNCERHGLPDENREWELTTGRRNKKQSEEKPINIKICEKCFAAQLPGKTRCSFCGAEFEIKYRKVDEEDGELVEVDVKELRRKRLMAQGKCKTLEELVSEGRRRKYKNPRLWAKHVFNARQKKKLMGGIR